MENPREPSFPVFRKGPSAVSLTSRADRQGRDVLPSPHQAAASGPLTLQRTFVSHLPWCRLSERVFLEAQPATSSPDLTPQPQCGRWVTSLSRTRAQTNQDWSSGGDRGPLAAPQCHRREGKPGALRRGRFRDNGCSAASAANSVTASRTHEPETVTSVNCIPSSCMAGDTTCRV